jgi:hypothetical protein
MHDVAERKSDSNTEMGFSKSVQKKYFESLFSKNKLGSILACLEHRVLHSESKTGIDGL